MGAVKTKKIVFVCTGNTCRSPMAEVLLRTALKKQNVKGVKVCSAGLRAKKGDTVNPKSAQVLEENGLPIGEFSSAKLTDRTIREAWAIVCMTDEQRDLLMEIRWKLLKAKGETEVENTVWSFSELTGYQILDPYGKDLDCYRYVFKLLEAGTSAVIEKFGLQALAVQPKKRGRPKKKNTEISV